MIKTILARGVLVLACGTTAFTVNTMASHAATAPVSWEQRTCSAFTAWQAHPTTGRLDTLVTDSLHLPRGYLAADVLELGAAVQAAKPKQHHIDTSAEYVAQDCYGGL